MRKDELKMRNAKTIFLFVLCACMLAACGKTAEDPAPTTDSAGFVQIGNPWVEYDTLAEAEAAVGFSFPLEETVEGSYIAEAFRVCNGELLEVIYRDDTFKVIVRMKAGEHEDISGVYEEFDHTEPFETEVASGVLKYDDGGYHQLKLMIFDGYSYSFYAPNGYWGDSAIGFAHFYGEV